ncbi:MAG: hypothetical protein JWO52_5346 [Gammaproteobacteria bacterium]|nr:hypothetical protein [Gammaproteobacteria bacterium]
MRNKHFELAPSYLPADWECKESNAMSTSEAAAAYLPQWVSKIDVAVRQVRVAVRLYFEKCDPVALHTLAAAAHGVVADLAQKAGSPSTIGTSLRVAADFFRQAKDDPEGKINIEPLNAMTEDLLFDTVRTLQGMVQEIPFEARVYWAWFMCARPQLFQNCGPAVDSIMRDNQHLSTMSFREIRQFLRFNQVLDSSEPLPEWAFLGPSPLSGDVVRKPQALRSKGEHAEGGSQAEEEPFWALEWQLPTA